MRTSAISETLGRTYKQEAHHWGCPLSVCCHSVPDTTEPLRLCSCIRYVSRDDALQTCARHVRKNYSLLTPQTLKGYPALRNLPDHSRQSQPDYRHLGLESTEKISAAVKVCIAIKPCVSLLGRIHWQSTSEGMA